MNCVCERCQDQRRESFPPGSIERLIWWAMPLCSVCGNKRCPKATDHDLSCTGSNEPGQPGSSWEHIKP